MISIIPLYNLNVLQELKSTSIKENINRNILIYIKKTTDTTKSN